MKRVLLIFIPFLLQATTFLDVGVGGGYRQDRLSFKIFNYGGFNTVFPEYKDLRSPVVEGHLRGGWKYFYLMGEADYAWILSGKGNFLIGVDTNPFGPPFDQIVPFHYKNKNKGDLFDVFGGLGVVIPVWEKGEKRVLIIPVGGYSYSHQSIKQGPTDPLIDFFPPTINLGFGVDLASLSVDVSSRYKTTWWGPFFGAELDVKTLDFFEFLFRYTFHSLEFKQIYNINTFFNLYISPVLAKSVFSTSNSKGRIHDAPGHKFYGKLNFIVFSWWKLGFSGSYLTVETKRKKNLEADQASQVIFPALGTPFPLQFNAEMEAKWHTYQVLFESTFSF